MMLHETCFISLNQGGVCMVHKSSLKSRGAFVLQFSSSGWKSGSSMGKLNLTPSF